MGKHVKVDPKVKAEICKAITNGDSMTGLAKKYKLSTNTLYGWKRMMDRKNAVVTIKKEEPAVETKQAEMCAKESCDQLECGISDALVRELIANELDNLTAKIEKLQHEIDIAKARYKYLHKYEVVNKINS